MMDFFSIEFALAALPAILSGAVVTVMATIGGFAASLVIGGILACMYRTKIRAVSMAGRALVEVLRSTPLLIQVYFLFFILPRAGIVLDPFVTGVLGLGLYHGAYVSEAYRAGLANVPAGQWDAVDVLRFSRISAYRYVILPQAIVPLVPTLGSTFIMMLKDTPVLAAITVPEMMFAANDAGSQTFRYVEPMTMAALGYLAMSFAAAVIIFALERRMGSRV